MRTITIGMSVAALAAFSLAGCGGSDKSLPEPPADVDVAVTAYDIGFREKTLPSVEAGSVKFWYGNEGTSHTLRVKDAGGEDVGGFQLEVTNKGDVDEGSVDLTAGEYTVYCSIPGHGGMSAPLTVT